MQDICTKIPLFSVLFLTAEVHTFFESVLINLRRNSDILNEKFFLFAKNEYSGQYKGLIIQNLFIIYSVLGLALKSTSKEIISRHTTNYIFVISILNLNRDGLNELGFVSFRTILKLTES